MWQHMFCVSVMCSALRRELILFIYRRTVLYKIDESPPLHDLFPKLFGFVAVTFDLVVFVDG